MGAVTCPRSAKSFRNEVLSAAHKFAADSMARDQVLRVSAPCGEGALSMLRIATMEQLNSSNRGSKAPCPPGRFNAAPEASFIHSPESVSTGVSVAGF